MPAASSSSATGGVRPEPPAAFSPLATQKSTFHSRRISGNRFRNMLRPGLPTMSPMKSRFTGHSPISGVLQSCTHALFHGRAEEIAEWTAHGCDLPYDLRVVRGNYDLLTLAYSVNGGLFTEARFLSISP